MLHLLDLQIAMFGVNEKFGANRKEMLEDRGLMTSVKIAGIEIDTGDKICIDCGSGPQEVFFDYVVLDMPGFIFYRNNEDDVTERWAFENDFQAIVEKLPLASMSGYSRRVIALLAFIALCAGVVLGATQGRGETPMQRIDQKDAPCMPKPDVEDKSNGLKKNDYGPGPVRPIHMLKQDEVWRTG